MKRLSITFSALLAAALILSPAAAENLDLLKPLMKTTTPSGNGPFPAVLFLSGASGFHIEGGNYDGVQADLTRLGFVVIRVDSLEARGLKSNKDGKLTFKDQSNDIRIVVTYLKSQTNIKQDAINVLGWSLGGQGALAAAQDDVGITRAVAYYPPCHRLLSVEVKVPALVLSGEADDVVSLGACRKWADGMKAITLHTYPNAHHAFDNKNFDPPKKYPFGTIGYDATAAQHAWSQIERFLAR